MGRRTGPLVRGAGGRGQKGVVRHLDLMVWGVVHRARVAVLGGWGEELGAGHGLADGGGHDLRLLWEDGVYGHAGVPRALLELWGTEVPADEVLAVRVRVWVLQLDTLLLLLLLLKLLEVLYLLHLLSLLLHHVGLRTQSSVSHALIAHHLRQAGVGAAVVQRGCDHSVLPALVQTSLAPWGASQGVELAGLAHVAVHPGQPITLAIHGTLTA